MTFSTQPPANGMINVGNLLLSLSDAIDLVNPVIAKHQHRTAFIADSICTALNLDFKLRSEIFIAALLHDIGAISAEEKMSLLTMECDNPHLHCMRGELLLNRIPEFGRVPYMVRFHHTSLAELAAYDGTPLFIAAQILLLADHVEHMIVRDSFILHQTDTITDAVRTMRDVEVRAFIADAFLECARRESFWFDLMSERLYSLLFYAGPLVNTEITYKRLEEISKLFRDIIDYKSPFTATHTTGVCAGAELIGKLVGCNAADQLTLKIASNFHDIGKLYVPLSILNKPAALTRNEFAQIKSHAYYSFKIIDSIPKLRAVAELAGFHHEKLNGSGYPYKKGDHELSVGCRIITMADIFTALLEKRPYRQSLERRAVEAIIQTMEADGSIDAEIAELVMENYAVIHETICDIQATAKSFYEGRFLYTQSAYPTELISVYFR